MCHWSIAMAGGYATYGDWSDGVSYFYMGEPGPGKAALQLKHLRAFFEDLPFAEFEPHDELTSDGFCLAKPREQYIFYFPRSQRAVVKALVTAIQERLQPPLGEAPLAKKLEEPETAGV